MAAETIKSRAMRRARRRRGRDYRSVTADPRAVTDGSAGLARVRRLTVGGALDRACQRRRRVMGTTPIGALGSSPARSMS
jgi:hypothetical protein